MQKDTVGQNLKLPLRDLLRVHEGLNSLDGSKAGKDEVVPFEFEPAVSWKIAKNATVLDRIKVAFDRTCRALAAQFGLKPGESLKVGPDEKPDPEKLDKFGKLQEAIETAKDVETEVSGILFISLAELLNRPADADGKVRRNPIPQSVRNKLVPIITESAA